MRVHFLASTLARGGAETMAVALGDRLAGRGHDVRWTLLREPGVLGANLDPRLDLRSGLAPGKRPWSGVPALRARLAGADALYALDHQNAAVLAAVAAPLAGVKRRTVAIHTTGRWGGRPSLDRPFRTALRAYHAVLALSSAHARYLIEREGVAAAKVRVVPNGIDLDRFRDPPCPEAARAALDLPPGAAVLGSVAMLRPEKNLESLLDAAARLRAAGRAVIVVLVGEGPEREALERRAARDDLAGAVRFLGLRDDVPALLPAFDLFVLPSHPAVETQPVAALEAMAAGVPVVATRVGDLEALLEGGGAGALVPPGDPAALTEALAALLDSEGRRAALRERGRRVAARRSLDASADALLDALGEGPR